MLSLDSCQTFLWVPDEVYEEETASMCGFPVDPLPSKSSKYSSLLAPSQCLSMLIDLDKFFTVQYTSISRSSWLIISPCSVCLSSGFRLVACPITATPSWFQEKFCMCCLSGLVKWYFVSAGVMLFLASSSQQKEEVSPNSCKPHCLCFVHSTWEPLLLPLQLPTYLHDLMFLSSQKIRHIYTEIKPLNYLVDS